MEFHFTAVCFVGTMIIFLYDDVLKVHGVLDPPRCSQYDFEEKVLQKLVVLEHTVKMSLEDMDTQIRKLESETKSNMSSYETDNLRYHTKMDKFKTDFEYIYHQETTKLKDDVNAFKTNMETNLRQHNESQDMFYKTIEEKQLNMTENIGQVLQDGIELLNNESTKLKELVQHEPVAFVARYFTTSTPSIGETMVFPVTVINHGDAYNNSNGIFTAPVGGSYLFSVQICTNERSILNYQILSEDKVYSTTEYGDYNFDDVCSSVTAVAVLKKGEQIRVKCTGNSVNSYVLESDDVNLFWNIFNGVLIQASN